MRHRLALSQPAEGACGETGSWRLFRPVVDRHACNSCGTCVMFCPERAVSEEIAIDPGYCKGCGICANECPKEAIRMIREEQASEEDGSGTS